MPWKPHCSLQDATFEMERQRNRPVKYDRELVQRSVKAMQKVEQVGGFAHALCLQMANAVACCPTLPTVGWPHPACLAQGCL